MSAAARTYIALAWARRTRMMIVLCSRSAASAVFTSCLMLASSRSSESLPIAEIGNAQADSRGRASTCTGKEGGDAERRAHGAETARTGFMGRE